MADTKNGREKQADDEDRRQREREISEARTRADESEPPRDPQDAADEARDENEHPDSPRECHRRGCTERATFVVRERYQEETGHGAVEAEAVLCREHTAQEHPANLDGAYADYVFEVEPLPQAPDADAD